MLTTVNTGGTVFSWFSPTAQMCYTTFVRFFFFAVLDTSKIAAVHIYLNTFLHSFVAKQLLCTEGRCAVMTKRFSCHFCVKFVLQKNLCYVKKIFPIF